MRGKGGSGGGRGRREEGRGRKERGWEVQGWRWGGARGRGGTRGEEGERPARVLVLKGPHRRRRREGGEKGGWSLDGLGSCCSM